MKRIVIEVGSDNIGFVDLIRISDLESIYIFPTEFINEELRIILDGEVIFTYRLAGNS